MGCLTSDRVTEGVRNLQSCGSGESHGPGQASGGNFNGRHRSRFVYFGRTRSQLLNSFTYHISDISDEGKRFTVYCILRLGNLTFTVE